MPTVRQINTLMYFIVMSRDMSPLAKKLALLLIEESKGFKKEVCVVVKKTRRAFSLEDVLGIGNGFHDMNSYGGTTHMHELMIAIGFDWHFSSHIGTLSPGPNGKMIDMTGESRTVWLGKRDYTRSAKRLGISRKRLDAISLEDPLQHLRRTE